MAVLKKLIKLTLFLRTCELSRSDPEIVVKFRIRFTGRDPTGSGSYQQNCPLGRIYGGGGERLQKLIAIPYLSRGGGEWRLQQLVQYLGVRERAFCGRSQHLGCGTGGGAFSSCL
jgi:hypothetical protein